MLPREIYIHALNIYEKINIRNHKGVFCLYLCNRDKLKEIVSFLNNCLKDGYPIYYSIQIDLSDSSKFLVLTAFISDNLGYLIKNSYIVNKLLKQKFESNVKILNNEGLKNEYLRLIKLFEGNNDFSFYSLNKEGPKSFRVQKDRTFLIYDFYSFNSFKDFKIKMLKDECNKLNNDNKKNYLILTFLYKKKLDEINISPLFIRININNEPRDDFTLTEHNILNKLNLKVEDIKSLVYRNKAKINSFNYNNCNITIKNY